MNPIHLPNFRPLPGLALSIGGIQGRVSRGFGGVLLWEPDYPHDRKIIRIDDYMPSSAVLLAADPSTGGCLVQLLGTPTRPDWFRITIDPTALGCVRWCVQKGDPGIYVGDAPPGYTYGDAATLGEACVAVAGVLGWGGDDLPRRPARPIGGTDALQ